MADDGDDVPSNGDRNTKKVRLKGMDVNLNSGKVVEMLSVMAIDSSTAPMVFWKDKLVGSGSLESGHEVDLEFLDGDIMKSTVNGIPTISFSKRVQKFLVRDMATTMVVKLSGSNVSYMLLYNMISSLWKPSKPFHLMDVENKYFLVKFHGLEDYEMVLTQGLWIVLGQYLTVQPWTLDFNPLKPFLSIAMNLEEIDGLIGKVAKFDFQTDSGSRGMVVRMIWSFAKCLPCNRSRNG
ncbi:hypothetical protein J1N35_007800 [Gossypium stocksii]|uniref:DUF4283 domain-containing protein n=1 Tax=Gossypium stocksii TaxID=47602 RepID=A0A9D3W872_9ROSI|nr:hypothetical protein J1N35_007800 [Gossypium stocksii]